MKKQLIALMFAFIAMNGLIQAKEAERNDDDTDYRETMGPWPFDLPLRALPARYCGKCIRGKDGTLRRQVRYWPFDLPVRVLPTSYCGGCEEEEN